VLAGCTLTHPLDKYGAGGPDALAPAAEPDATIDDAGCVGDPQILEPTPGQDVGPAIHLRVDAPLCITTMIAYVNGTQVLKVNAHAIDQWVPVPVGTDVLNVNGWAGTATAHTSPQITFTRRN